MLGEKDCAEGALTQFTDYFVLGKTIFFREALLTQDLVVPKLDWGEVIKKDRALLGWWTDKQQAVIHASVVGHGAWCAKFTLG